LLPFQVAGAGLRIFENRLLTNTPSGGYAAAPATIAAKPGALQRFARAIVKAALLVQFDPAGAARLMLLAYGAPFDDATAERYARALALWRERLPASDPANPAIGFLPPDGVARYAKLLCDFGLTAAPVPAAAVIDNRFNAFANAVDRAPVSASF
jgi:ABC-type nitrate/sulfonate/bicarbonate transport system substrate-binding protein